VGLSRRLFALALAWALLLGGSAGVVALSASTTAGAASVSAPRGGPGAASTTTDPAPRGVAVGSGSVTSGSGSTVTIAVPSIPESFDDLTPAGSGRVAQMITEQVLPRPFVVGPSLQPILDSNFVTSAYLTSLSPQTIVYTIAAGARWSDGMPVTASDFSYFWHAQLAAGATLPADDPVTGYQDIASVTGSNGGRTVTVVFTQPYSDWEALFAGLLPAQVAESSGPAAFAASRRAGYVSAGPYEIASVVPGVEVVLERNRAYWGPPAHVQTIVFRVVRGDRAVLAALGSGTVDVGQVTPGRAESSLVGDAAGALTSETALGPVLWQLVFNLARPALAPPAARRAIGTAIDRNEVLADSAGLLFADTPRSDNRLYAAGEANSVGHGAAYRYANGSEADSMLSTLGYTVATNGMLLTPAGKPFVLTLDVPSGNPTIATAAGLIQAELLQAGIAVVLRQVAESQLLGSVLPSGGYEMALAPYPVLAFPSETEILYTDPVGPTPLESAVPGAATPTTLPGTLPATTKAVDVESGAVVSGTVSRDVLGFNDPVVTALYGRAIAQQAPLPAASAYNAVDARLWFDLPTLPLFQMPVTLVSSSDIVGVANTDTPVGPLWNAQDWVVETVTPSVTSTAGTS
jgi:peptide/nickel transport system substrate-binding protein